MHGKSAFTVIDSHTAGATTRIVTSGGPVLAGNTMREKMEDFRANYDHVRRTLMLEPRGNANMTGAFITETTNQAADMGIIFTHANGFHAMCGHGAIGVACAAVETDLIASSEPSTSLMLETPAGLISVRIDLDEGCVQQATFRNVPSFVIGKGVIVGLASGRNIKVDVAHSGVPVILANAEDADLEISLSALPQAIEIGLSICEQVANQFEAQHPETLEPVIPNLVMFSGSPTVPNAHFKDVVVSRSGDIDRSPCGAATCARMAQLHAQGKLSLGEEFIQEGILGTVFSGRLVSRTKVGSYDAVIPEVSARAHIIGLNRWIIDADDPLDTGFAL